MSPIGRGIESLLKYKIPSLFVCIVIYKSSNDKISTLFGGKLDIDFNKFPFLFIVYPNGLVKLKGRFGIGFKYLE